MASFENLLPLLNSSLESERIQGVLELLRVHDQAPLEVLFQMANEDSSCGVRYYARRAFAALKGVAKARPAEAAATVEVAKAAQQVTDPGQPDLEKQLGSLDPKHRLAGMQRALASSHSGLLPLLIRALHRESIPELRASFITVLGRLGSAAEIDLLVSFLGDRDPRVRANAVEALSSIGTEEAVVHLIPLLQDDDHRVKANAIVALADVEGGSITRLLRNLAMDGEIWTRDAALHALDSLNAPFALQIMGEMAQNDQLQRLRTKAIECLSRHAARGELLARQILGGLQTKAAPPRKNA